MSLSAPVLLDIYYANGQPRLYIPWHDGGEGVGFSSRATADLTVILILCMTSSSERKEEQ